MEPKNARFSHILTLTDMNVLTCWADESERCGGLTAWGPKFQAVIEVSKRVRSKVEAIRKNLEFGSGGRQVSRRFQAILDGVELGPAFPWPVNMRVFHESVGVDELVLRALVPDRNSGEPIVLKRVMQFARELPEDQFVRMVRHILIEFAVHEVEEAIHVNGRFDDPHAREPA